ncbi:MAG TPA: hypothetical protein VNI54_12210 [Thermoanaerobaculia bacterium]|nr:hypothetical protein [Thermoanaerobaculia bacterium]
MLLERRVVSRKTPGDGRLEITKRAAGRLRDLGHVLEVELSGQHTSATLESMTCTCRGEGKPHAHYFLQSSTFKRLTPGVEVDLELDETVGVVRLVNRARDA